MKNLFFISHICRWWCVFVLSLSRRASGWGCRRRRRPSAVEKRVIRVDGKTFLARCFYLFFAVKEARWVCACDFLLFIFFRWKTALVNALSDTAACGVFPSAADFFLFKSLSLRPSWQNEIFVRSSREVSRGETFLEFQSLIESYRLMNFRRCRLISMSGEIKINFWPPGLIKHSSNKRYLIALEFHN